MATARRQPGAWITAVGTSTGAETLIRGKRLMQRPGSPLLPDAALLVRDGTIIAVGREAEDRVSDTTDIVDLSGYVLTPGLIDCHVHLVWSGGENPLYGAIGLSRADLTIQAIVNMQSALARGITTVRDCGGIADVVIPLSRAVESGEITGPAIVNCGSPITTTGGHCWFLETEAEGVVEVQKAVRRMHRTGADFIKVMVTGGGSTAGSNPAASQYTFEELEAIASDAHRLGHFVTGHAHGTEGILLSIEAEFDGIEHCSWLSRDGNGEDYRPDAVDRIIDDRIFVCKTIAGFQRWPLEELSEHHASWRAFATMRAMAEAGVPFVAGTDGGITNTNFADLCLTLETMIGLGGMTAEETFRSATELAARALGLEKRLGALEVGKQADCIALDTDPIADIKTLRSPRFVIRNGRIVARDGRLLI